LTSSLIADLLSLIVDILYISAQDKIVTKNNEACLSDWHVNYFNSPNISLKEMKIISLHSFFFFT
jgi:hypothetical protein